MACRDVEQPEIGKPRDQGAEHQSHQTSRNYADTGSAVTDGNAIQEKDNFGALPQNCCTNNDGESKKGFPAFQHFTSCLFQLTYQLAAMPCHPRVVPSQHHYGDSQNCSVEYLLAKTI